MQRVDNALWIGFAGFFLSLLVYFSLRDSGDDIARVFLTAAVLLLPLLLLIWRDDAAQLGAMLGEVPKTLNILLAAAAGLAIWPGAWWLMELANEQLAGEMGPYLPGFLRLDDWTLEVVYKGAILPLMLGFLVFGAVRDGLVMLARPVRMVFMGLFVAVLHVVVAPQGLVGLVGYGLVGALGAYFSVRLGSWLGGVLPLFAFTFANLAFLDDLRDWVLASNRGYFDTEWLTLVLLGTFGAFVCVQIVRFRTAPDDPPPARGRPSGRISGLGWAALALLGLGLLFYAASEIDQRNEARDQLQGVAALGRVVAPVLVLDVRADFAHDRIGGRDAV
ncbi:MAG: hypothetical protein ACLFTK_17775 [Anaerolineales bacterium]